MPSIDPSDTFKRTIAGIEFELKEQKASGVRKIGKTILAVTTCSNPMQLLDLLTPEVLACLVSWNKDEPLSPAAIEDSLTVSQMMDVLRTAVAGSKLTEEEQKKSE